jgi:flagellar hook-associated protein 2
MAGLSSPGVGSGLNVSDIVSKLMTVEQQPLVLLTNKEAPLQAQLSAYGTIKGALAGLRDATNALATPAKFNASVARLGDATIATASASTSAVAGTHTLEVQTLAKAHTLATTAYAATSTPVGSGTITIQFGKYDAGVFTSSAERASETISIPSGQTSLASVRDAINSADAGVSASIVNDGTGYRLVLTSGASGTANALRITVDDDDANDTDASGLSALTFDASTGGTSRLEEKVAAQDATLVVDGITITKSQNLAADVIEGVTLTLTATGSTTVTVARDTTPAVTAVQTFVKAYNDLQTVAKSVSGYDPATGQAGSLLGDPALRGIQSALRNAFNGLIVGAGGAKTLSSVGVSFEREGILTLDTAKLTAALADPQSNVSAFFASGAKASDSSVKFLANTRAALPGTYPISITQVATRGYAAGSAAAATTIVAGVNDSLTLSVDGKTRTVTLNAGTYTAATLVSEVQSRINTALKGSGAKVAVSQSAGVLTVTSDQYGADSKVALTSGSALADLFGTPASTDGVDVAGSIGSFPTAGSGRVLSGGGLAVEIDDGVAGDRGTISYASGFASRLTGVLADLLESDGPIASRTAGINRSIKDIDRQRDRLSERLVVIEARYRAQFSALDTLISRLNSTSNFLTQQLANLANLSNSSLDK